MCGPECTASRHRRRYRDYYAVNRDAESQRHRTRRANPTPEQRASNYVRRLKRRSAEAAADAEVFDPVEIFIRDTWTCQLCFCPIDPELRHPDRWSASLDHVIPLSLGGPHTRANSRAAHLTCNSSRGNRMSSTLQPDMGAPQSRHGR